MVTGASMRSITSSRTRPASRVATHQRVSSLSLTEVKLSRGPIRSRRKDVSMRLNGVSDAPVMSHDWIDGHRQDLRRVI